MSQNLTFSPESPMANDLLLIFQRHTADMHANTPPESIHMMPRESLISPDIDFFVLRRDENPVGMVALKRLGGGHAEVKSMHVLAEARGTGLARIMLGRLMDHARRAGQTRMSLETGSQPSFSSARELYTKGGFSTCPPFGDYRLDPNSVYMTRTL